ncbi:MAG: FAD-binding domain-containing protein, partial [Pseudomonadota bacterium]
LGAFIEDRVAEYSNDRDRLDRDGTSGLSENLALGEISPRQCWAAGMAAHARGSAGAETFVKEVVWREFAYHLLFHTPQIAEKNWRPEWDGFPWRGESDAVDRWRRGRTGEPVIDAAMRQLYVTGTMHNRARMLVASYLTKHLMTHWRIGQQWFEDCLIDWDPASNAMGWQWAAGSGPDAAPFFRIFNPATQAEKFDPQGSYRSRYVAEGHSDPHEDALSFFEAAPKSWGMRANDPYPQPMVDLKAGREAALAAYKAHRAQDAA